MIHCALMLGLGLGLCVHACVLQGYLHTSMSSTHMSLISESSPDASNGIPLVPMLYVALLLVPMLVAVVCTWSLHSSQFSRVLGGVVQWAYQEPGGEDGLLWIRG